MIVLLLAASLTFVPFAFTSDYGETVAAEKAWLTVPERRGPSLSGAIELPVVRFRSTSATPASPLVFLAGGPGDSGLDTARHQLFPLLMALRDRGDVIVFDQRGTGDAKPSLKIPGKVQLHPDQVIDSRDNLTLLVDAATRTAEQMRASGIDLGAYNTVENAHDVDDLRQALAVDKISIWGHSYGSHLGLAVLRLHGAHIDHAILGGVNGPDQRWRLPGELDALIDTLSAEATAPKLAAQVPNLRQAMSAVLSTLKARPVMVKTGNTQVMVAVRDVQVMMALSAGDTEFVHALPIVVGRMQQGDFSRVAQRVAAIKAMEPGTAMRFAMHIASGVSAGRSAQIEQARTATLFSDAINFPFESPAFVSAWKIPDLGDAYRAPVVSAVPTLFISGSLDGRTSVADADAVRANFTNSLRLIVEGAAHDLYHRTPAVLDAMRAFLDGRPVPASVDSPMVYRGPDEPDLIQELLRLVSAKGTEAATKRLREMAAPGAKEYLTSYVTGTLGVILAEQKKPKEAIAMLEAGLALFPNEPFLAERLADLYRAQGDRDKARALYQACLKINPMNRAADWKSRQ